MANFKIKLEDKAAFLNRLEKQDVPLDSSKVKDNKLKGYFEVDIVDPKQLEVVKTILKQSPKINTVKEMKKSLNKDQLKEMIRQELSGVLAEKKKMKGEYEKEKLNEVDAYGISSMEMAAKDLFGWAANTADGQFAVGVGLVVLVAGGLLGILNADKLKQAKDTLIGWWKGAKADLSQEEQSKILDAAARVNIDLDKEDY
jgi:hypothetical protein